MNILVTGGAGFIGSHIVDAYLKKGHRVSVVDNLVTGFRKNVNKSAKLYKADIRDLETLRKIFKKERPHIVNHHAAIAEVVKSLRDPIPTMETNVLGTINLLLCGGELGIKKFIFSSTGGAMYGDPNQIPAKETTTLQPLSPYGLSKLLAEESISYYARAYGFNHLIFRYANVYGPRQNPKGEAGVVAIFGGLLKAKKTPIIYGDGTKTRDYVHVDDVVRANILALTKGANATLNLGLGKEIQDKEIFSAIAATLRHKGEPSFAPHREGELLRSALDATLAHSTIGWKPTIQLKKGIAKTIQNI